MWRKCCSNSQGNTQGSAATHCRSELARDSNNPDTSRVTGQVQSRASSLLQGSSVAIFGYARFTLSTTGAFMTPARLLVPLSLALLAACAQQPKQIVSLEDQKACPITLKTGQTLMLMLPSNPTTGHRWLMQNPAPAILSALGPEVFNTPEEVGMVGTSGQSVWRYRAANTGSGHLMMVYQQPWA